MYTAIIILILICAVFLVLVILAQNPKGGGLSALGGGGNSSQMMGVKRTTDLLEKLTWGFAIAVLGLSLTSGFFIDKNNISEEGPTTENIERAKEIQTQAPQQQQAAPAQEEAAPANEGGNDPLAAPAE